MNILVIDDDSAIFGLVEDLLREILPDCEIQFANDGKEAEDLFMKNEFDLLISDILLPKQNGIELTRKYLKHFPEGRVLVMTGGGSGDDIVKEILLNQAVNFGACVALGKPFELEDFKTAVLKTLDL